MDIKIIIRELGNARMTQYDIADACGCSQGTINKLFKGHIAMEACSYGTIIKLIDLHAQVVLRKRKKRENTG